MMPWRRAATSDRPGGGRPFIVPSASPASPASLLAASKPTHLCDEDTLLALLDGLVAKHRSAVRGSPDSTSAGFAVFHIALRRSDRTKALAGVDSARATTAALCESITALLRRDDRFALCGVDEVLLVLPEVDSTGRALLVASRLAQVLGEPLSGLLATTRLRASIGCALHPAHGSNAEELISAADQASTVAGTLDEGYAIARPGQRAVDESRLAQDLEAALQANQLEVWLQPQLNLRNGLFDAAEALIRWPRADGLPKVSPIQAVELAEANGLMPDLTLFVLNTVLRQSSMFRARGIDLRIAINMSASMLTDANLPMTIRHALELWDVAPDRLTLEVTENTLMNDVERSLAILDQLKALGAHLSLDDFGTGYSSFAYLRRMPLDELKIDQLFVRNLNVLADGSINPQRDDDLRIVRSIIDIAHNFELQTVAEGVEDETTLALLKSLGCDVIQGYFTGRPMPMPQFEPWWKARQG